MQARSLISFNILTRLMNVPEDWEIVDWEPDDSREVIRLKVYIDTTDLPMESRKRQVRVHPTFDESCKNWTWNVSAEGPYRNPNEPAVLKMREQEDVPYPRWRNEMIAGLRCPKCFWLYPTGIGERVISECESCLSGNAA